MYRLTVLGMLLAAASLISASLVSAEPEPEFERQPLDQSIKIGYGVVVGHVDGDAHPDLLLADKNQYRWYENPGEAGVPWKSHVMAENLTEKDNVCIAARDLNGDGRVEVAVGAQWNPGNNRDPEKSGALFYLKRPGDPTERWEPIRIEPHEPTIHRIRWARTGENDYQLISVPLRPRPDEEGSLIYGYERPDNPTAEWSRHLVTDRLTKTHNFEVYKTEKSPSDGMIIGGQEGLLRAWFNGEKWLTEGPEEPMTHGAGEVRTGKRYDASQNPHRLLSTIEPMHGNRVVAYRVELSSSGEKGPIGSWKQARRTVLDKSLNAGHSIEARDILGLGYDQIVAGWRKKNENNRVGIKLYVPSGNSYNSWETHLVDDDRMACEYLQVADLNGDDQPDIVASGRATNNLVVYWNRSSNQ